MIISHEANRKYMHLPIYSHIVYNTPRKTYYANSGVFSMQQQEHAKFDLLAVFNDENKADAAEAGLHKAGFGEDEVFRLAAGSVVDGQFREHGPNRNRSAFFLQTTRSGPSFRAIIQWAVILGALLGVLLFLA